MFPVSCILGSAKFQLSRTSAYGQFQWSDYIHGFKCFKETADCTCVGIDHVEQPLVINYFIFTPVGTKASIQVIYAYDSTACCLLCSFVEE